MTQKQLWSGGVAGVLAAALVFAGASSAHAADVVIPDANLRACLNSHLGQGATDPITDAQAASLGSASCDSHGIADLSGIEAFSNLTKLDISYNQVTDLAPLDSLTALTDLSAGDNPGLDLITISGLTNLTRVDLTRTGPHADLTPLASLTSLRSLDLGNDSVTDLSPLSALSQLETAYLSFNQITDLTPLSSLTRLKQLYLDQNAISDVTPLAGLADLWILQLDTNSITDLSPLAPMAAQIVATNGRVTAENQRAQLPPLTVGATQHSPLLGMTADAITATAVPTPTSAPVTVAADGMSWVYGGPGLGNQFSWEYDNGNLWDGRLSFSGVLSQDAVAATALPTALIDDEASTKQNTPVTIDVLANDGKPGEPALDPGSLLMLDGTAGAPSLTVTGGIFAIANGRIVFTPASGFTGTATARYTVTNADGLSSDAEVSVTVLAASGSDAGSSADGNSDGASGNSNSETGGTNTNADGTSTTAGKKGQLATTGGADTLSLLGAAGAGILLAGAAVLGARRSSIHRTGNGLL